MSAAGNNEERALETLKALLVGEERSRLDGVRERVARLEQQAGDDEALQASVTRIIAGALRDAEVERHDELARSIAPMVVSTIRYEIVNSRDQMVEALYPITGQLVSAYVASAMRDLMEEINRRLESGLSARRYYLRMKSFATGRPYSELVLAELNAPRVEALYLVRRGSGELIDSWSAPANMGDGRQGGAMAGRAAEVARGGDRERLLGSFLTALTEFAREAFRAEEGALQTLDLQSHRIYLRASPAHLIAAKCSSAVPHNIERALDGIFLEVLSKHADALAGANATPRADLLAVLPDFASRLESELTEISEKRSGGNGLATGMLGLVAAALVAWLGWTTFVDWRENTVREQVLAMKQELPSFQGYPVTVRVDDLGRRITLEGLAQSLADRDALLSRIDAELSPRQLRNDITIVPDLATARELAGRTDALNERLSGVARLVEAIDPRQLQAVTGELEALRRGLAEIEQRTAAIAEQQAEFARVVSTAASRSDIEGEREARGRDRAALEQSVGSLAAALAVLQRDLTQGASKAALEALDERLAQLVGRFGDVEMALAGAASRSRLAELHSAIGVLSQDLAHTRNEVGAAAAGADVARLVGVIETLSRRLAQIERQVDLGPVSASLETLGSRLGELERTLSSPSQRLDDFISQNAVFFDTGTNVRNDARARAALRRLAQILVDGDFSIRVVGYTDDAGSAAANELLAVNRAEAVKAILLEFGVKDEQVITVGRAERLVLSNFNGPGSPNRRVEFERGFAGER
ncbi:MAG: OmpA family protein [Rhizobiales bacterium]|nr:OmpA family protein [Hyphomicrobiales bacterium]